MTRLTLLLLAALTLAGHPGRPAAAQAAAGSPASPAAPTVAAGHAPHGHDDAGGAPGRTPARAGAAVYIILPRDGAVVRSSHVRVLFGARDFGVAPAGVDAANTGHHHLLVDAPLPEDMSAPVPSDRDHLHFGAGQTETVLDLPPGTHTLQLLMGDAGHVPHDPPLFSPRITIRVRPGAAPQRVAAR